VFRFVVIGVAVWAGGCSGAYALSGSGNSTVGTHETVQAAFASAAAYSSLTFGLVELRVASLEPGDTRPVLSERPGVGLLARGSAKGDAQGFHSADTTRDRQITVSELVRVIQFYNSRGLHCAEGMEPAEDGYQPGSDENAQGCPPHDSDYAPQDWVIRLSELLRLIQFFSTDGYRI